AESKFQIRDDHKRRRKKQEEGSEDQERKGKELVIPSDSRGTPRSYLKVAQRGSSTPLRMTKVADGKRILQRLQRTGDAGSATTARIRKRPSSPESGKGGDQHLG